MPKKPVNQCDGCRAGMHLDRGVHYKWLASSNGRVLVSTGKAGIWYPYMTCTKDRYVNKGG